MTVVFHQVPALSFRQAMARLATINGQPKKCQGTGPTPLYDFSPMINTMAAAISHILVRLAGVAVSREVSVMDDGFRVIFSDAVCAQDVFIEPVQELIIVKNLVHGAANTVPLVLEADEP